MFGHLRQDIDITFKQGAFTNNDSRVLRFTQDLHRAGYAFSMEWLEPFFEFRFPRYGTTIVDGIEMELRFAIEPWHVLGEEVTRTGTARYVDSSVERMQIKVSGFTEGRYVLTCNGRRLPLRNTGRNSEFVAGVRYRAWQPPSALHPTISPHTPLVFDVIDTWNGHAIGGCTYFVAHPGRLSYEDFPVNDFAAETRRITRFWDFGHSPGAISSPPIRMAPGNFSAQPTKAEFIENETTPRPMAPPMEEPSEEFPFMLDLRYSSQ